MRVLAIFVLFLAPLCAIELKIDHVTVAGTNVEAMRKAFTAATGLPTEYGGPHSNHASEMALVSFPDGSYMELMGIQAHADAAAVSAHEWRKFLQGNAGPCAFAIRATNSIGIETKPPRRSGRTRPDGTRLEWETTDIGPGTRGTLFPFLIRDFTPRENRAYLNGQPTTRKALGVSKVVVGVQNLEKAVALYRRAFQLAEPKRERNEEFGADLAWFEGTPVILAQALAPSSWLARRVQEFGEAPCAFVLRTDGIFTNSRPSPWFGGALVWFNQQELGWRLGRELGP